MDKVNKIWLDGKFIDWDSAKIHILTHSLHYGSAIFEGIRCYKTILTSSPKVEIREGAVFRLKDHVDRFFYSAGCIGMKIPYSKKAIQDNILKLIKLNKMKECYIRPIAFYGGSMGLSVFNAPLNVAIAVWPWGAYLGDREVNARISKYRRIHPKAIAIDAKISGYYANSILASIEAKKMGATEAVLLDDNNCIAEGPGENIFIVKNKKLYTPSRGSILPGITRDSVIKLARDRGVKVIEKKISVSEFKNSDEAFFTGTAVEICPIHRINNSNIGSGKIGPITLIIKKEYEDIVRGSYHKYRKWLTYLK